MVNAIRDLGTLTHQKKILAAADRHCNVVIRRFVSLRSEFSSGPIYLHDFLILK